jgi:two-component system chemotaxis response regulator CheB
MSGSRPIGVLIVDDAMSIRLFLKQLIDSAPDMTVLGMAADPVEAMRLLQTLTPDVLTLDVEMPHMDGLTFLEKLMRLKPLPVVMLSTLTAKGSDTALKALELGAVDVLGKPSATAAQLPLVAEDILTKLRAAAHARVGKRPPPVLTQPPEAATSRVDISTLLPNPTPVPDPRPPLIALGASTGGTEALRHILTALPATMPPIVMVQHMPAGFTTAFAARLDAQSALTVREAQDGLPLQPGHAYLAAGDRHLSVIWRNGRYVQRIIDAPRISRHRPSVDVLFRSVAAAAGAAGLGVLLTGMGDDGAQGLLDMRTLGGVTLTQDEATCVVYGMPRAAMAKGASMASLPLPKIAPELVRLTTA